MCSILYELGVDEDYRGKGVAKAILSEIETKAAYSGSRRLRLTVHSTNTVAIDFYEAHGFEHVDDSSEGRIYEKLCGMPGRGESSGSGGESSAGESSAGETSGAEDGQGHFDEDGEELPELMEELPDNARTLGMATAVDVCISLSKFQVHMYEPFDDRSMAERDRHGDEGQALGREWRDALKIHTQNNANWYYPHQEAEHYKERIKDTGSRVKGDDSALETAHKLVREERSEEHTS